MAFMGMVFGAVFLIVLVIVLCIIGLLFTAAIILKIVGKVKDSKGARIAGTVFMIIAAVMLVPIILPQDSRSPSPSFCPSRMVVPMAKELMRLVTVIMICEPTATPETSSAVANFPTTSRSTAP